MLAAVGRGATRYSEIANLVDQRIDYPIDVLTGTGFLRRAVPIGAPKRARPTYEIPDPYLRFWFNVLYSDLPLIDAGQGAAVLKRLRPRWQTHVASVFEDGARSHAQRLVASGVLPPTLAIGRWWSTRGQSVEIDVLGLDGNATRLLGEVKWSRSPLTIGELARLQARVDKVPNPVTDPIFALWGREGVDDTVRAAEARGFNAQDVVDG